MLEVIFEILFQIFLELLLEIVGEFLTEIGLSAFGGWGGKRERHIALDVIAYIIIGGVIGGLSYPVFPHHLVNNPLIRIAYTLLSPIFLGLTLCLINWILVGRAQRRPIVNREKFISGILLGATYSVGRYMAMNWS